MKNYKIEIKWAIVFVGMMLAWMLIEKLAGFYTTHIDKHHIFTNFIAIPAIAIYVFALLDKRKNFYHGNMSYKQGFITGLIMTVIITVFSPLTQYIISAFIATEYFPNMIRYNVEQGKMKQAEAEAYFNLKNFITEGLIGSFVMGLVTTAIVAIFTRRNSK
ncbi:MAG: rane protein [Daejeonella sp.]|nr:rane protein [Daejeonella sp.]